MGGLIPAWATNYCRSIVVNKATAWTEDLRRHLVQRKLDVPSLAEISKDLLPQWTEHWDETEARCVGAEMAWKRAFLGVFEPRSCFFKAFRGRQVCFWVLNWPSGHVSEGL